MKPPPDKTPNLFWRTVLVRGEADFLGRWNIGPKLRAAGFKAVDLWADGAAFTREDCRRIGFETLLPLRHKGHEPMSAGAARKLVRILNKQAYALTEQRRKDATTKPRAQIIRIRIKTTAMLIEAFNKALDADLARGDIKQKTVANYKTYARKINAWHGDEPPASLTKSLAVDWLKNLRAKSGPNAARVAGQTLTHIFRWAETREEWASLIPSDPRAYREFHLKKPAPRLRVGLPEEMTALLQAFDHPAALYAELETPAAARQLTPAPSMGDALLMMLWTAARVNDALSMANNNFETGRVLYRQAKTGAVCNLPILEPLEQRLPAMRKRRDAIRRSANITDLVINEADGYPYWRERPKTGARDHRPFNDRWNEYRALAAKKVKSLGGEGVNALGEPWLAFRAQDCRDTAVSRLALATTSLLEIAAWHGSDVDEITKLAKHYIAITPQHADQGGEKLAEMCAKMGIAV
jgi:hypothetical protein